MNNALDVSRYIINYSHANNYFISNLKLQKIMYFVQANFLVNKNEPCFNEPIEAWDFGPVIPVIYNEYKVYAAAYIPEIRTYLEYDDETKTSVTRKTYNNNYINDKDKMLIKAMVDQANNYSSSELTDITCQQSPWINAYKINRAHTITTDAIKEYFTPKN